MDKDGDPGVRVGQEGPAPLRPRNRPASTTLLLAEPNSRIRGALDHHLDHHGFRCLLARDGREALDLFRTNNRLITLTILDQALNDIDVERLFHRIRSMQDDALVLLTGNRGSYALLRSLMQDGMAGFLPKPFGTAALLTKITETLRIGEALGILIRDDGGHWKRTR